MKNILDKIKHNRYFLLFVFLFAYVQSIQIRILSRGKFTWHFFTPEAAVFFFFNACLLFAIMRFMMLRWQKSDTFNYKEALKIFSASLVLYMVVINVISLLIALAFDTFERNFNLTTIIKDSTSDLINTFVYGSFFLAYYYYGKNKKNQNQIGIYNQALSESKINQLKTQLSPHFLFNNLNVLDQLIEEDKHKASIFLNEFSEIYRYVLQATDKKLILLEDELSFAKNYFGLMQHKYGEAYQLEIIQKEKSKGHIVPLTLQLLLENAIQHNLGVADNPVLITVAIDDNLVVSNNIIEKKYSKITSGRALVNLKEQYDLLSHQKIEINHTKDQFLVTLPIIQK